MCEGSLMLLLIYITISYLWMGYVAYHDAKIAKTSIWKQMYPAHLLAPMFAPVVFFYALYILIRYQK